MKKGIVAMFSGLLGATVGAVVAGNVQGKTIEKKSEKVDKFKAYYNLLNQWLSLRQEGKTLEKYFADNNIKTIAIYGMGELGNRLFDELKNSTVTVKYAIDKNAESTYSEIEVIDPENDFEPVDAIIVTAVFAYDKIEEMLREKTDIQILSLEDVVYEV